ncbi:uncharacterized protein MONBRDRAFT_24720 [Monosiga brevicollis MX1]|uniref:Uncharacterized protein n=1 Tax=Monosiga brevicollis TaxID=81824 RepID=A9UX98_MONBE|nr:uncharacterized protein MONBRDRAFT_24720 [Monosiga brevicollis MX1]EDQ90351.1 predicted protein [Monosiga brevicollis MX1]|eukprot:XP_001745118.1 hypothetical protein [Monosiga brevicollis MX1]
MAVCFKALSLLLAALALPAARAQSQFYWVGCNTNFNNNDNWSPAAPTMNSASETPVQVAYFGPELDNEDYTPVNSLVKSDTPYAMNMLVLPENGQLTLDANNVVIEFYKEEETEGSAVWVGAQTETDNCRLDCHKNWVKNYGQPSEVAARLPPCASGVAVFDPANSYHVMAPGVNELRSIVWNNIETTDVTSLPPFTLSPGNKGDHLRLYFDDNQHCIDSRVYDPDTAECFCHTSCPASGDTFLEQDQELRARARAVATTSIARFEAQAAHNFVVSFNLNDFDSSILDANALLTALQCTDISLDNSALTAALQASFADLLSVATVRVLNINTDVSNSNRSVEFSGTIEAPTWFFNKPSSATELADVWTSGYNVAFTNPPTTSRDDRLALAIWMPLTATLRDCPLNAASATYNSARTACDNAYNRFCSHMASVVDVSTVDAPTLLTQLNAAYEAFSSSGSAGTFALNASHYQPADNHTEAEVQAALADLSRTFPAYYNRAPNSLSATAFIEALHQTLPAAEALFDNWYPNTWTFDTFTLDLVLGQALPQADIRRMLNERNKGSLTARISSTLTNMLPIMGIDSLQLSLIREDTWLAEQSRRRRDFTGAGQAVDVIRAVLTYEGLRMADCTGVTDGFACPNAMLLGSDMFTFLGDMADDAVSTFTIQTASCYDVDDGIDQACLLATVNSVIADMIAADSSTSRSALEAAATSAAWTVIECVTGDCSLDEASTHPANAAIAAALAAADYSGSTNGAGNGNGNDNGNGNGNNNGDEDDDEGTSSQAGSASSGSSAGGSMGIIIGIAAGAVVLVLVVVFLLVRSRRNNRAAPEMAKPAHLRSVVSFENPIYDSPEGPEASYGELLHDSGEDQGLYDEPAIATKRKNNPVYRSNDMLDEAGKEDPYSNGVAAANFLEVDDDDFDGDDDTGGGYLDVHGDDDPGMQQMLDAFDGEDDAFDGGDDAFDGQDEGDEGPEYEGLDDMPQTGADIAYDTVKMRKPDNDLDAFAAMDEDDAFDEGDDSGDDNGYLNVNAEGEEGEDDLDAFDEDELADE